MQKCTEHVPTKRSPTLKLAGSCAHWDLQGLECSARECGARGLNAGAAEMVAVQHEASFT